MNTELKYPKINHAGVMIMNDGTVINYGVIRYEDNKMISYTQEYMIKMFGKSYLEDARTESEKINDGDITTFPLKEISYFKF